MNKEKTIMTNGTENETIIKAIDYVDEYVCLYQIISPKDLTTKEIEKRIEFA